MTATSAGHRRPGPLPHELPGAKSSEQEVEIDTVLRQELAYLWYHRHPDREKNEVQRSLIGLAFSGGGIRSATTCLGVLQALSNMRILPLVDYLSTVSGGGYIGACLSSLLSLNPKFIQQPAQQEDRPASGTTQPPRRRSTGKYPPGAAANLCEPFEFAAGEAPIFTTTGKNFPFHDARKEKEGRLGVDLIAHLRTHGNFLIARSGMLRRDAMRAAGNLLTGISYNIFGFLLVLFTVSAIYLFLASVAAPDMRTVFERRTAASVSPDISKPGLIEQDSSVMRVRSEPCAPGSEGCAVESRVSLVTPSLWQRITHNGSRVTTGLLGARGDARAVVPFLIAFGIGAVVSALLAWWVAWAHDEYLSGRGEKFATTKFGEGEEDAFERSVLRRLAVVVAVVSLGVLYALRVWDHSVPGGPAETVQLMWLFVPFAVLLGARASAFLIAIIWFPARDGWWRRRMRSLWGGYQAITIYGWWLMLGLAILPLAIYAVRDHHAEVGFGALGSLLLTRLLASRAAIAGRFAIPPSLRRPLLALVVVITILFGVLFFGALLVGWFDSTTAFGIDRMEFGPARAFGIAAVSGLLLFMALGMLVDHNKLGPHYFYRDRLAETYLLSELPDDKRRLRVFRDAMEMPLHCLHGDYKRPAASASGTAAAGNPSDSTAREWRNPAPYHLISAAINLAGSRDLTRKDRKSGYWLFSKLYCGSVHTGFRPTKSYRSGETKLGRAVAISGAAASSAIGFATFFAQAFATVLFNIRLGYWVENPSKEGTMKREESWIFWPRYLAKEMLMTTTEVDRLVNLSDGGHTGDNVGVYPLLQRRCKVIIACDAERDPTLTFGSFTEALRHAYIDMGISVDIDLTMIRPDPKTGLSRSHCAVGRIRYPDRTEKENQESYLIYMKNSLTGDEPEPMINYKTAHRDFPHETTVDQFFDDAQFESYRALGVHLAEHTFGRWVTTGAFDYVREKHQPTK